MSKGKKYTIQLEAPPDTFTTDNVVDIMDLGYDPTSSTGSTTANLEHLVFLVKYTNNTKSILKGEVKSNAGDDQVHNVMIAGTAMELVDSRLGPPVTITDDERTALRAICKLNRVTPSYISNVLRNALSRHDTPSTKQVNSAGQGLDRGGLIWVKLAFKPGLTDAKHLTHLDVMNNLTNAEAMRKLGKIIAVDLFNNNADRFADDGGLANEGNLFFLDVNGKAKISGLDYLYTGSSGSDVKQHPTSDSLRNWDNPSAITTTWLGRHLKSVFTMRKYAEKVVESLNATFGDSGKMLNSFHKINLLVGMELGCSVLKKNLKGRTAGMNLPANYQAGLAARMKFIGW